MISEKYLSYCISYTCVNMLEFDVFIKQALLQLCYEIHRKEKRENENETHMHLIK